MNMNRFLKKLRRWIGYKAFRVMNFYFSFYPLNKKRVCFLSDVRTVMGGNLKCVYDYLEAYDYERIIEFKADRRIKRNFKQQVQLAYHLSTSKYIILDDYATVINNIKVRKKQELVQLWHGAGAFKKFGWSRLKSGESITKIHPGYKKYTKAIVSGEGVRWCFAEAFSISIDKVKATGFPRTDFLFDDYYIQKIKYDFYQEYPHLKDKKLILFAPTWRGTEVSDAYYDFQKIDFKKIYEKLHDDYVFMIKWHPAIYNNAKLFDAQMPDLHQYHDFYQDFSKYRDINELLVVCDCLITDYSSVIFDYSLLHKPLVYFTYDYDEYVGQGGRGLYFDFDEYIYGPIAKTTDELIDCVESHDLMEEKRKDFYDKFMDACDGHSTKKTCQWIFNDREA